jgi:hypothetical protein
VLENLRQYFNEMPILADLIGQELKDHPSHASNAEDLRAHIEALQTNLAKRLKAEKRLYAAVFFPEAEVNCQACGETILGVYWELNNPATGKGLCVSHKLLHGFIDHEQFFAEESMHTVAGTHVGSSRQVLDLPGLVAIMEGAEVPAAVMAEARQSLELQKQALAAAGAFAAAGGH